MTTTPPATTLAPSTATPDVDLRDGVRAARRWWWLIVLGVVLGLALSLARGHSQPTRYEAHSTVYIGQPVSPNGGLLPTISSKAATAIVTATSDEAIRAAADAAGVKAGRIRGEVVATAVASPLASKLQQPPPIIKLSVRDASKDVADKAATAIGSYLVADTSGYALEKTKHLQQVVTDSNASIADLTAERQQLLAAARGGGANAVTYAVLVSTLAREVSLTRQDAESANAALSLTKELETSRVIDKPNASQLTSASGSRGLIFGAFLGLLLGLAAAWIASALTRPRA